MTIYPNRALASSRKRASEKRTANHRQVNRSTFVTEKVPFDAAAKRIGLHEDFETRAHNSAAKLTRNRQHYHHLHQRG